MVVPRSNFGFRLGAMKNKPGGLFQVVIWKMEVPAFDQLLTWLRKSRFIPSSFLALLIHLFQLNGAYLCLGYLAYRVQASLVNRFAEASL